MLATTSAMYGRDLDLHAFELGQPRLLNDHFHFGVVVKGVVGADLGAEAVLQGRDYPASARVVLGVRRGHEHYVERQPDLVAADLHVSLLEDVEEADLDPLGQVGQFVDGKDPAVGPWHQPVVQG